MGIFTGYQLDKADAEARKDREATRNLALRRIELMEEQFTEDKRQTTLPWISKYQDAADTRDQSAKTRAKIFQKAYLTDMIQELVDIGVKVHCVIIERGWKEIDTVEDYQKALKEFNQ